MRKRGIEDACKVRGLATGKGPTDRDGKTPVEHVWAKARAWSETVGYKQPDTPAGVRAE